MRTKKELRIKKAAAMRNLMIKMLLIMTKITRMKRITRTKRKKIIDPLRVNQKPCLRARDYINEYCN